jgi:hypothetical protein
VTERLPVREIGAGEGQRLLRIVIAAQLVARGGVSR